MGTKNSKHGEVTDTGVVNSNFIVEEQSIEVPKDIRVVLYFIAVFLAILVFLSLRSAYRRKLKKNIHRSMVLRTQAGDV